MNQSEKLDLANGISRVLGGYSRLAADAEPVENPGKMPSIEGLKPAEAEIVRTRFNDRQKAYCDWLLRKRGTLSASEQAFLRTGIKHWHEAGRPDE